jgi:hypothetical protein
MLNPPVCRVWQSARIITGKSVKVFHNRLDRRAFAAFHKPFHWRARPETQTYPIASE